MTTATLQQLVHLRGRKVGRRAVIVGAEHVSFSAVATLAHGGASVAGLVTELPRSPVAADLPRGGGRPLPGARLDAHQGQRDPRRRAGRVGGADRARLGSHPDGRVRPGHLHRRLDPRPRAGGDGRLRARSGNARAAGRPRTPHDAARRVRGGEPAASCRDGRRLRSRRPPCGPGGRRVPARSRRVAVRTSGSPRGARWPGSPRTCCWRPGTRRRATASCSDLASSSPAPGYRSARTAASSGAAGWAGSCRDARPTSRPAGPPRSIHQGGPVIVAVK